MSNSPKFTERFSSRVADYAKYRPDYPRQIVNILHDSIGLSPDWLVADVGGGTGISSRMFMENGNEVFGVEPNDRMRQAAETEFSNQPKFHPIKGTGEATNLPDASVDLVIVAQAFHWFDHSAAAHEFKRILRSGKGSYIALIWNQRLTTGKFATEYEELLQKYGNNYKEVAHRWAMNCDDLSKVFAAPFQRITLANEQRFDLAGLNGRAGSSSYVPEPGETGHQELYLGLKDLFERHQEGGMIKFEYETEIFIGSVESRR